MIPEIFFSIYIFPVCNETFMIRPREHNCRANEKTELISYFIFAAERLNATGVHFYPDISFAKRDV